MQVCAHPHSHTHSQAHTLPPLQGHHGFSSAEVGVGSTAWFFQLLGFSCQRGGGKEWSWCQDGVGWVEG